MNYKATAPDEYKQRLRETQAIRHAQEAAIEVEVGLLLRATMRRMLERSRFNGMYIRWIEDKRLLYSVFTIRGPAGDVRLIGGLIQHWLNTVGASK